MLQKLSSNTKTDSTPQEHNEEDSLKAIIVSLANTTNMKLEWCKRCLEENAWNLQNAFNSFTSANLEGKIPPEAFN